MSRLLAAERNLSPKTTLLWPARPRRESNTPNGQRLVWQSRCGRYRITRYPRPKSPRLFYALVKIIRRLPGDVADRVIWESTQSWNTQKNFRSLAMAMLACARHAGKQAQESPG